MLLDLMMPVMSGEELLDELAAVPLFKHLPICVLTASDRRLREDAVSAVLRKPFEEQSLMNVVARYCQAVTSS